MLIKLELYGREETTKKKNVDKKSTKTFLFVYICFPSRREKTLKQKKIR